MKQQLDEVRTLAIKLFNAGKAEKFKQGRLKFGVVFQTWRDLPSESVAVWDAVALCAHGELSKRDAEIDRLKRELKKEEHRANDLGGRLHRIVLGIAEYKPDDDRIQLSVRVNRRIAQEFPCILSEAKDQLCERLRRSLQSAGK